MKPMRRPPVSEMKYHVENPHNKDLYKKYDNR